VFVIILQHLWSFFNFATFWHIQNFIVNLDTMPLNILLNIDSNGRLTTTLYDERDFDFAIVNCPFLCSNIPLSPTYGVYISQLIRCTRACFAYDFFFSKRGILLTKNLMLQGYNESCLTSFRKFCGRYNDLVCNYKLSLAYTCMLNDLFHTLC
jgi:hypothetical protein